jgi:hypothetical protein
VEHVKWTDKRLDKITSLQITLIDYGYYIVSQCEGHLKTGERVYVSLPFNKLPRWGLRYAITEFAKRDNVYAKGLGIFDSLEIIS